MRNVIAGSLLLGVLVVGNVGVRANVQEPSIERTTRSTTLSTPCEKKEETSFLRGILSSLTGIIIHLVEGTETKDPAEPLCGVIIH